MTETYSNLYINSLSEESFIAGTYKEFTFDYFDIDGDPVNISSFTCAWVLSPFGSPDTVSLSKSGVYRTDCLTNNRFTVYLYSDDTLLLSGKYVQQPIITGNPGYDFRLGQGIINIIPAITG